MAHPHPERHCLITGGAGFIGSHLAEVLLREGCWVTVVDNLSTGRQSNLNQMMRHPRFRFVKLDVANRELMAPLVSRSTEVYHLASYVGVRLANLPSSRHILNNLHAIDTILDLVAHYRPKFLLTSSSEVYGNALSHGAQDGIAELYEDGDRVYGATNIHRWSYAGIKAVEEFLTLGKHHEEGIHAVIIRPFNVVGPRQIGRTGMVLPRFIDQALRHDPITVYGDGSQMRCFTYIDDVIHAIQLLMQEPKASGQIFNVGNTEPISVKALAEKIITMTKSQSVIEYIPIEKVYGKQFEDVQIRIPNVDKLARYTGFRPGTPLETLLTETIAETDYHHARIRRTAREVDS